MSSTGTTTSRSSALALAGVDHRGPRRPRPDAAEEAGDLVERPLRGRQPDALERPCIGDAASSRSRDSARCAPRLVPATAWISSTITCSTPRRISRACEVSSRYSDSGVVIRMSGGCARCRGARRRGVSPVRMATRSRRGGSPQALRRPGRCRPAAPELRSTSCASAFSGETYSTRQPALAGSAGGGLRDAAGRGTTGTRPGSCRAGRREDQGVLARGDGRPALRLRGGGRRERGGEPVANRRTEDSEGVADAGRGRCGGSGAVSGRREAGGRGAVSGRSVPRGGWRSGRSTGGHGTPSIGPTVHFEQLIEMV